MFAVPESPIRFSPPWLRLIAVVALCAPAGQASAEQTLESMLVSASGPDSSALNLLEPTTAITATQIQQQQAANLNQLISGRRGVYASREGGPGGVNSLSIRGAEPNFSAVLIDGVAVNDPTNTRGGSFDLATLAAGSLRRIEVIAGPQSLAYGSDSLAGVILLTTFDPAPLGNAVSGYYEKAESGAFRSGVRTQLADDSQSLALRGGRENTRNTYTGSSLALSERALRYSANGHERWQFTLGGREAEFGKRAYPEQSGGPEFAVTDDRDSNDGRDQTYYLTTRLAVTEGWSLAVQFNEFDRELDYDSPGVAPYNNVPANRYRADYERKQWRLISEVLMGPLNVNAGVDRRWEQGDSRGEVVFANIPLDGLGFLLGLPSPPVETGLSLPAELVLPTDYALRRTTAGKFLQANWQFDSGLVLSAGVRRDATEGDDETTRRYLAALPVSDNAKVTASYSEGYKSPSFFALGHGLVGNPDLRPERAESYQLTFDWQWSPQWLWQLSLFNSRYRDLIDFDAEQFTNVNRNRVDSEGGELSVQWQGAEWRALVALSRTALEVVDEPERHFANRPEKIARFDLGWTGVDKLSWFAQLHYVGSQYASSLHSGETREQQLDAYTLVNTALRWQALPQLGLTAAIDNVFNQGFSEAVGFPGPGRLARVGIELSF